MSEIQNNPVLEKVRKEGSKKGEAAEIALQGDIKMMFFQIDQIDRITDKRAIRFK